METTMTTLAAMCKMTVAALTAALILGACGGDKPEALLASAKEYLAKNDGKAAVIQLKNALQNNPNLPEARFLLGKALLASGDAAAAEIELRKALELKYPTEQATPVLARSLLARGQFKKVTDEFAKVELPSKEAMADLLTTIGQADLAQGRSEEGKAAFAAAVLAQPDFVPARLAQSRMMASSGDFAGAMQVVDATLSKSPGSPEGWKLKGDILSAQRQSEPAIAAYRKALDVRPDFQPSHVAIVSLLLRQGKTEEAAKQLDAMKQASPGSPQLHYLQALLAFQQKNFTSARESIQTQLKVFPDSLPSLQLAGLIEYALKSYSQAEAHLLKVLQAAPNAGPARRALIATYLQSGQPAKALDALQPIVEKIDTDSAMLALAGQVYLQNNDPKRAEEYFAKSSKLDPGNAAKRTSLAMSRLAAGNDNEAFGELEQIAATDTGVTADMALIASHIRRREFDKALAAIAVLEKKQPNDPLPPSLRGGALLAKGDASGARKSFDRALAMNPGYFTAAAGLANLDLLDKKPEEAKKRFESVLAVDPKNSQALLALADLRARSGAGAEEVAALIAKAVAGNPTESLPRLALIAHYTRVKDTKKAVAAAQEALAVMPDRPELLDAAGRAQRDAGDTNQALATYKKLAGLQPGSPLPYMRIAEIQVAAKDKDAAQDSLRKALAIKPDLVDAQRGLVQLYLAADQVQPALVIAKEIERQRPKEAVGYLIEGDIHASRKAWAAATASYRGGLAKVESTDLAVRLHAAMIAGGGSAESDKFAESWKKAHPKDGAFRLYLAENATARKDYGIAAKYYRAVLEGQPNSAAVLNNLAWVTAQMGDPKAIDYAEQANSLAPNQPAVMDTLGVLLVDRGDMARGIDLLQKAVELAPQAPSIRLNLAKALIKNKQNPAARRHLDELAKLGDKFAAQAEVAKLLQGN